MTTAELIEHHRVTQEEMTAFYMAYEDSLEMQPREHHQAFYDGVSAAITVALTALQQQVKKLTAERDATRRDYHLVSQERDDLTHDLGKAREQCDHWKALAKEGADIASGYLRERDAAHAQVQKLRAALEPSAETKAAYMGEFRMTIRQIDEYGDDQSLDVAVPWTTIKEIMKAIRDSAAPYPRVRAKTPLR